MTATASSSHKRKAPLVDTSDDQTGYPTTAENPASGDLL